MHNLFNSRTREDDNPSNSDDSEEESDESEESESSEDSPAPGPLPDHVNISRRSIRRVNTDITNFTQDSYEQFEKPKILPKSYGSDGHFLPSRIERSIRDINEGDEYISVDSDLFKRRDSRRTNLAPMMSDDVSWIYTSGQSYGRQTGANEI